MTHVEAFFLTLTIETEGRITCKSRSSSSPVCHVLFMLLYLCGEVSSANEKQLSCCASNRRSALQFFFDRFLPLACGEVELVGTKLECEVQLSFKDFCSRLMRNKFALPRRHAVMLVCQFLFSQQVTVRYFAFASAGLQL